MRFELADGKFMYEVGDTVSMNGTDYVLQKAEMWASCAGCAFQNKGYDVCRRARKQLGECVSYNRRIPGSIIFVEAKEETEKNKMKLKKFEITVAVPGRYSKGADTAEGIEEILCMADGLKGCVIEVIEKED